MNGEELRYGDTIIFHCALLIFHLNVGILLAMKAVIMAGGEGKRLKKVSGGLPKPMVPLLGKPLMERIVELLREAGVTEICAALGYEPAPVIDHFGDGSRFGVQMSYRIEDTPLGTAGGVKNCADFYGDSDFIVISGDAACDLKIGSLIERHKELKPAVTMALYESAEPLQYGLVLTESGGNVRYFTEKPSWERVVTNLVNTGIYIMSPRAMDYVPVGERFDFAHELFPLLLEKEERIAAFIADGYWSDVGTPKAYFKTCMDALEGRLYLPDVEPEPEIVGADEQRTQRRRLPGDNKGLRRIGCDDRAKLMRAISEYLMDYGAEFSDGISMEREHCGLRISPSPTKSEILIETSSEDTEFSEELATAVVEMVKKIARK